MLVFKFFILIILGLANLAESFAKSTKHHSYTLNASVGSAMVGIKTFNPISHAPGLSFNSAIGYIWKDIEVGATSLAVLSKNSDLKLITRGTTITGDGKYRSVAIGPFFKYFTPWWPLRNFRLFTNSGILVSQSTIKPRSPTIEGGLYGSSHKLTYEGYGGFLSLGLSKAGKNSPQQLRTSLHDHLYIELTYKVLRAKRISELSGTKTKVELVAIDHAKKAIFERTFFVAIGARFF